MAKPIAVIYLPENQIPRHRNTSEFLIEAIKTLSDKMPDYYWLVFPIFISDAEVRVEVFHEKDITDTTYQELRDLIIETIKTNNEQ